MRRVLLLSLLLLPLTACTLLYRPPVLELTGLRMGSLGFSGTEMVAHLNVGNPNFWDVRTVKITYDLTVEGEKAGNGVYEKEFVVPAGGTMQLEFPVKVSWSAALGGFKGAMGKGAINTRTTGVITLRAFFGDLDIPYEIAGRIAGEEKPGDPARPGAVGDRGGKAD